MIFKIIAHHITIFGVFGHLFVENIIIRFCFLMTKVISGSIKLIPGIFGMCGFSNTLDHRQGVTGFI
ncbi:hypothetical protein D3C81_2230330 [compost metagenome]